MCLSKRSWHCGLWGVGCLSSGRSFRCSHDQVAWCSEWSWSRMQQMHWSCSLCSSCNSIMYNFPSVMFYLNVFTYLLRENKKHHIWSSCYQHLYSPCPIVIIQWFADMEEMNYQQYTMFPSASIVGRMGNCFFVFLFCFLF